MPGAVGTDSPSFNAVNRGKRSVVLNLKTTRGVEAVKALARTADIFVENYRPGVMETLGLDYASLSALNPRLIYASISGYGQTGPDRNKGGFDLVAQGVSGIMSVTGEPRRRARQVRYPADRSRRRAVRHRGHSRRARAPSQDRTRPAGRHLAPRRRRRAVGLGSHAVFLGPRHPGAARLSAPHERAVSGVPLRGRIHHRSAAPTIGRFTASATCSDIRSGATCRSF